MSFFLIKSTVFFGLLTVSCSMMFAGNCWCVWR